MRIGEMYGRGRPVFSFEFFPPKTDRGYDSLYRTIAELKTFEPDFVSVTWGAGGSTRSKTVELVIQIQQKLGMTVMAHLTCIGSSREQLTETLDRFEREGIENVLALAGDSPPDRVVPQGAFTYANELVSFIRSRWSFCLGGACYPETHVAAPSREADLENLVRKANAGVDFLITQLFFDNTDYFSFVKRARDAGIGQPIVPGIMPIISAASLQRMTSLSGARIPPELDRRLAEADRDEALIAEVGVQWATVQCRDLIERGAPGIHFFTMNKSAATRRIFQELQQR